MNVHNQTRQTQIANQARLADSFMSRLVGLLKTPSLEQGQGLVITSCQQIHMFFMKYALDVIFIDKNNHVVGLVEHIKPGHVSPFYWSASKAIEVPAGTIQLTQTALGDHITIQS